MPRSDKTTSYRTTVPGKSYQLFKTIDIDQIKSQIVEIRNIITRSLIECEKLKTELQVKIRRSEELSIIEKQIIDNKDSYASILGVQTPLFNTRARNLIECIRKDIREIIGMKSASLKKLEEIENETRFLIRKVEVGEKHIAYEARRRTTNMEKAGRTAKAAAAASAKQERLQRQAIFAQAHLKSMRTEAVTVKRHMRRTDRCPYCFLSLGADPHADHIHPVAKGGLSTERNMIMVCKSCNAKKKDMTLNQFINKFGLGRDLIYEELRRHNKDY